MPITARTILDSVRQALSYDDAYNVVVDLEKTAKDPDVKNIIESVLRVGGSMYKPSKRYLKGYNSKLTQLRECVTYLCSVADYVKQNPNYDGGYTGLSDVFSRVPCSNEYPYSGPEYSTPFKSVITEWLNSDPASNFKYVIDTVRQLKAKKKILPMDVDLLLSGESVFEDCVMGFYAAKMDMLKQLVRTIKPLCERYGAKSELPKWDESDLYPCSQAELLSAQDLRYFLFSVHNGERARNAARIATLRALTMPANEVLYDEQFRVRQEYVVPTLYRQPENLSRFRAHTLKLLVSSAFTAEERKLIYFSTPNRRIPLLDALRSFAVETSFAGTTGAYSWKEADFLATAVRGAEVKISEALVTKVFNEGAYSGSFSLNRTHIIPKRAIYTPD